MRVSLTEDDFLAARWLHVRPRPSFKVMIGLLAVCFLAGLFGAIYGAATFHWDAWLALIGMIASVPLLAVYFKIILPRSWRRTYRQAAALHVPMDIAYSEERFETSSEKGGVKLAWQDFRRWKMNGRTVLLYISDQVMCPLRKHWFENDEEWQKFLGLLRRKLGEPVA